MSPTDKVCNTTLGPHGGTICFISSPNLPKNNFVRLEQLLKSQISSRQSVKCSDCRLLKFSTLLNNAEHSYRVMLQRCCSS
ncbi:TPA: hypothetical protein ACH3X1_016802 [Trebouxia sp. C0004]